MKFKLLGLCLICIGLQNCSQTKKAGTTNAGFYNIDDYASVKKTDAHIHINTNDTAYLKQAQEDNFRYITINLDDVNEPPPMEVQQGFSLHQTHAFPNSIAYATTFSVRHFNEIGWKDQAIAYLKNSFEQGAVGVKIYKVIGMTLKDTTGKMVMIDDPRFDPVIDFIIQNNITVLGHLGEPKNCWMPVDSMTINGDKSYFSENPLYHMYLHPEMPSYEQQIAARDHMLERHPNLRFVGAHLGSLEWSVDELAKRLDKFPNMAVDMAARIPHLEYQSRKNWQKVHDFLIKYQDRLLYATDLGAETNTNATDFKKSAHEVRIKDWEFFVTSDEMTGKHFDGSFKGLHLPKSVINKIYRGNAEKWYPGIRKWQNQ
jgi:predicted TIM-barrel fold metal-dependent hydrolase